MRLVIKHAFNLKSAGDKLLTPGQFFTTDDPAQVKELTEVFMKDGACEELKSSTPPVEKPVETPKDPAQDLSTVPGVGKTVLEKLTAKGITTVEQLKAAVTGKEAEMKELFGTAFKKVQAHFKE